MDNTGYTPEEPIAAVATALAPAALGIIRVSGKNSIQLLSKIFSRPKALSSAAGNTIVYGWIVERSQDEGATERVGGGHDCSQGQNAPADSAQKTVRFYNDSCSTVPEAAAAASAAFPACTAMDADPSSGPAI